MVPALLRGDLLFIEFLLYVKGFPNTIKFTFHSTPMQYVLLIQFYK